MSFHSIDYLLFLPLVVTAYFALPARLRWILLLLASMVFYASWRIEFLPLLWISILVDYVVGRAMPNHTGTKRGLLLGLSLAVNLGLLCFFKFAGVFAEFWGQWSGPQGGGLIQPMNLLLPLGISFYTFQTLGYVIDIYRGRRKPEEHLGYFAVYVTFFPQLIAGPIERSTKLMPQLRAEHTFTLGALAAGSSLMLIGYFKKLVIADAMPGPLTAVLSDPASYSPLGVLTASFGTMYYYYADLSGYADIAIGSALIFGIKLSQNFNRPFAAKTVTDFWQRWHITVSQWFRDYLYLPFVRMFGEYPGGRYLGLILTMLVVGLWHGASLTWVTGGLVAGIIICIETARAKHHAQSRRAGLTRTSAMIRLGAITNRFIFWAYLILLGALVASSNLGQTAQILERIVSFPAAFEATTLANSVWLPPYLLLMIAALEIYQWFDAKEPVFERLQRSAWPLRWAFYYVVLFLILIFGIFESAGFLYFRF